MKSKSCKVFAFKSQTIANFQPQLIVKARSWEFSCFTGTKHNFEN
ncbi:hypothetical protein [Kordia zhangzhouensis]|nr:hypothetical protein [Kordia zhangzhouensis]